MNALGPYNHGTWENLAGESVGREESLTGRSEFILEKFDEFISKFSNKVISNMSILDIGSYDGYIAHQIAAKYDFHKVVSAEPRRKNIEKGKAVRKFLAIDSRIEIVQASLRDLSDANEVFDIVVCVGVLHHTSSTFESVSQLAKLTKIAFFLETQVYYDSTLKSNTRFAYYRKRAHNEKIVEPKDIIYLRKNNELKVALSGHKLESNYFDGSTELGKLVELPTVETIKLSLLANDINQITVLADPKIYAKQLKSKLHRTYAATIISGLKDPISSISPNSTSIAKYELAFLANSLDSEALTLLESGRAPIKKKIRKLKRRGRNVDVEAILSALIFDFDKKLNFEKAKHLIKSGNISDGKILLVGLTFALKADWRVTYRSFFILYILAKLNGEVEEIKYYKDLLNLSNEFFPFEIENDIKTALNLLEKPKL